MVNADMQDQDRKNSQDYIVHQESMSESQISSESPRTTSMNDVNSDMHGKIDLTYSKDGNSDLNNDIVEPSNSEDVDLGQTSTSQQRKIPDKKEEPIESPEVSVTNKREEVVHVYQEEIEVVKDENEVPYDSTEDGMKEIKEADASVESTNQSYRYLSFGNILKSIVDPVLEGSSEVLADMPSFDSNDSSLNLTQVVENTTLDKSVDDEELTNKTDKKVRFQCSGKNLTDTNVTTETVKIVNNTGLLNALNFDKNESISDCVLVLFFAPWCPFCAKMAPNYNALARAFPQLEVLAVDAAQFSNLNARFGTVLVPNILLFHQSRALVRFNQTDKSFDNLASFVRNITGLEPNTSVNVTDEDYDGPLSSIPTEESDYLLWVAWLFVLTFTCIVFVQSAYGQQCITKVRILWQEHQHID